MQHREHVLEAVDLIAGASVWIRGADVKDEMARKAGQTHFSIPE